MKTIRVNLNKATYPIIIGAGLLGKAGSLIKNNIPIQTAFIITNNKIKKLYGAKLLKSLHACGIKAGFIVVADTEKSKSIDTWVSVIHKITRIDKGSAMAVIAFGGGVIGDLAGFVAASYKRGVPLIQIPTTLLAQVDSAIGGKTAVDMAFGKNLIGAFYQPRMVISDINLLNTLPVKELKNGISEVIKYGVILDKKLFYFVEKNIDRILKQDKNLLLHIVSACSYLKSRVVAIDEKEASGYRFILNFGHTIGHALEAASMYSKSMTHGEAVSVGMACACDIARSMNMLAVKDAVRIEGLIKKAGLPTLNKSAAPAKVFKAVSHDKKIRRGKLRFILPVSIGHVIVCGDIDKRLIRDAVAARTIKN